MSEAPIEFIVRLRGGSQAAGEAQKIERGIRALGGEVKKVDATMAKAGHTSSAFGGHLKKLALGLGAAGLGFAAWGKAKQAVQQTTELARTSETLSKATGTSIGESSRMVAVSQALGVQSKMLSQVFTKVGAATVKQAEHTGKGVTAFDRLGISQEYARKHLNDTAGILDKITHNFNAEHIPALERSKLLTELFGKSWLPLGRIFLSGETNFKHLTSLAKEFGLELSSTGAEGIEKLKDQQEEYTLATMGMQVAFTKIVAGPLGRMLQGFAKLTVYAKEGRWTKFNKEVDKIGHAFASLAEKVLPRMAGAFAHVAPAVLSAFWKGFIHAPLGAQVVLGLALATKFGLTGAVFRGVGMTLGKSVAGGLLGQEAAAAGAGTTLGGFFGKAFAAAAAGYLAYNVLFKGSPTEPEPVGELFDPITGDKNKREKAEARQAAAERHRYLHNLHHRQHAEERRQKAELRHSEHFGPIGKARAEGKRQAEREVAEARIPKGAFGASVMRSGLVEVGERGPEVVHMPAGATVAPLRPGSLRDERPIILKVDGRVLARINRRELLQSQAAGA